MQRGSWRLCCKPPLACSLAVDGAHVHLEHVFGIEGVVMAAQLLRAAAFDDGQLLPDLGR